MNTEKEAADLNSTAHTKINTCNLRQNQLRTPACYSDFSNFENSDLILLTKELGIFELLKRFGNRTCMLCAHKPQFYDLSFCSDKEVYVLYGNPERFDLALDLARAAQKNGATKTYFIRMAITTFKEISHA